MYFLPDQAAEYDRRGAAGGVAQFALFVSDEKSALQWLRRELRAAGPPQSYQDIQPRSCRSCSRPAARCCPS